MDETQKGSKNIYDDSALQKSLNYMAQQQQQVPLIIQQSLTFDSIDGQNFPYKLWFIINNPQFNEVLRWSQDGTAIVFPDERLFLLRVLKRKEGKIFKTESLKSFIRQLNLYGFRKVMSDRYDGIGRTKFGCMFDHEYFVRGRPDLLEFVKRRCNVKVQKNSESTPNLNISDVIQNKNLGLGSQSTIDFGERLPKRRLRFSPGGKENQLDSPISKIQRMQAPVTPSSSQAGLFSFYQGYPMTSQMVQYNETATLSAIEEAATMKALSPSEKDSIKTSVITIPKCAMYPTPIQSKYKDAESKFDGGRISLADSLAYILSPTTPSEISQVAAAYLTTPTSLNEQLNNFVSPTPLNLYSATGPSPLSALCASLFSPLNDGRNAFHKATQTSVEPKSVQTGDCVVKLESSEQSFKGILQTDGQVSSFQDILTAKSDLPSCQQIQDSITETGRQIAVTVQSSKFSGQEFNHTQTSMNEIAPQTALGVQSSKFSGQDLNHTHTKMNGIPPETSLQGVHSSKASADKSNYTSDIMGEIAPETAHAAQSSLVSNKECNSTLSAMVEISPEIVHAVLSNSFTGPGPNITFDNPQSFEQEENYASEAESPLSQTYDIVLTKESHSRAMTSTTDESSRKELQGAVRHANEVVN